MARVSLFAEHGVNIERHAYCLCLHVRPATIFVALCNLVGSLICAAFTLYLMASNSADAGGQRSANFLASRLARDELNRVTGISLLMYLLMSLVSSMLLYGVLKSKPSYILPFFGIQFIDYLFTMPQFLASIYTHPYHTYYVNKATVAKDLAGGDLREVWTPSSIDSSSTSWNEVGHFNGGGLRMNTGSDSAQLYTTSVLFMTLQLIVKTYFLCLVWKCYRYLHMQQFILPLTLSGHLMGAEAMMTPVVINRQQQQQQGGNLPPPNYDEATMMPDYKPPEYRTVIEADAAQVSAAPGNSTANPPSLPPPSPPADTTAAAPAIQAV